MCPQSGTLPFGEDLNFKNIDSSTLPKLMDRQETPQSSPRSHFSRQCTLDSTLETTEPSPFSRQCTLDSCFAVQVDVLVSVPESASRMAFETYIQRAGLEEDAVVALDEKEMVQALLEAQEGDPERPLMVLVEEDWYVEEIHKLSLQRKPFVVTASGNFPNSSHYVLPASCGQMGFNEALRNCVAWSMGQRL